MLIDTHCHLYFDSFDSDRAEVLGRMAAAGVAGAVLPAIDAVTAELARALCLEHPHLRFAAGWHPGYVAPEEFLRDGRFDAQAFLGPWWEQKPLPVAVGEIGLDGRENENPMPVQIALFTAQLAFARERELPVIIHLRDADDEMLAALASVPGGRGVFHCFGGNPAILDYAIRHGWFISFAGNLTFAKAQALRDSALQVPLELLLVETDSPFLAPQAVRGKRCEPAFVVHTASELARLRGIPESTLHQVLTENSSRCFDVAWAEIS